MSVVWFWCVDCDREFYETYKRRGPATSCPFCGAYDIHFEGRPRRRELSKEVL